MGKLKEKLLNNLTPEEQEEMFGISAFEYVEYMENYKQYKQLSLFDDNGDLMPDDVAEQIYSERAQLENDFYEQSEIDDINDLITTKYSDSDVMYALDSVGISDDLQERIQQKLDSIWASKNGFE